MPNYYPLALITIRVLSLVIIAGLPLSGCSSQASRPTDEQMKVDYEKFVRGRITRAVEFAPTLPGPGSRITAEDRVQLKAKTDHTHCKEIQVLDSQTGESKGIRFYNAKVKATVEYWNGQIQPEENWMRYEKSDKGWLMKGISRG